MLSRRIFLCLLASLASILPAYPAGTNDGTVWAGVFLGSATASELGDVPTNEESKSVVERMKKVPTLNFANYRLLGEHIQPLLKEYESWLVPSRGFFFKLDSRGPDGAGGVRVAVQLWRDKEVLLKTDVALKGDRPVLIRGPALGQHGTLLVALRLIQPGE